MPAIQARMRSARAMPKQRLPRPVVALPAALSGPPGLDGHSSRVPLRSAGPLRVVTTRLMPTRRNVGKGTSATAELCQDCPRAEAPAIQVRRQQMPSVFRRLTRSEPGRMSIIDYSLIAVLTAYATIQVVLVVSGKALPGV